MDKVIEKLAALGVPGLIIFAMMEMSGLAGAAALTASLAALGPAGMVGGLFSLGAIGLVTEAVSEYGMNQVFSSYVKKLYKNGETKESIKKKINKLPISKSLKEKVMQMISELDSKKK